MKFGNDNSQRKSFDEFVAIFHDFLNGCSKLTVH